MSKPIKLDIAGMKIEVSFWQAELSHILNQRYKAFIASGEVQYNIVFNWEHTDDASNLLIPDISFDRTGVRLTGSGYTGYYDIANKKGELTCSTSTPVEAIDYFLRVIVAVVAFETQGILVHGAGILHKERGYLFFGQSGSGKTTISKLSVEDIVLNDDLVILMPQNEAWVIYGTPFWNPSQIIPKPNVASLEAMYLLKKDELVYIAPFKPSQALAEFLANVPIIIACERYSQLIIDRCIRILEAVPTYQLHFLPEKSFWRVIDDQ